MQVYLLTNTITGKEYVGITVRSLASRMAAMHPHRQKEMTMRKMMGTVATVLALLVLGALPVSAQRMLTVTTLAANVAAADARIVVTSSTGFVVGQLIYVNQELMRIQSLNGVAGTSTQISVTRGVDGTGARAHDNASVLIVSLNNTDFHNVDPVDWAADCTRGVGTAAVLPWPNTATGDVWNCSAFANSRWTATTTRPLTYNSRPTSFVAN